MKPVEQNRVVHTVGGQSLPIRETRFVIVKLPIVEIKLIGNILYAPDLAKNLFFVVAIVDKGLTIHFSP